MGPSRFPPACARESIDPSSPGEPRRALYHPPSPCGVHRGSSWRPWLGLLRCRPGGSSHASDALPATPCSGSGSRERHGLGAGGFGCSVEGLAPVGLSAVSQLRRSRGGAARDAGSAARVEHGAGARLGQERRTSCALRRRSSAIFLIMA